MQRWQHEKRTSRYCERPCRSEFLRFSRPHLSGQFSRVLLPLHLTPRLFRETLTRLRDTCVAWTTRSHTPLDWKLVDSSEISSRVFRFSNYLYKWVISALVDTTVDIRSVIATNWQTGKESRSRFQFDRLQGENFNFRNHRGSDSMPWRMCGFLQFSKMKILFASPRCLHLSLSLLRTFRSYNI